MVVSRKVGVLLAGCGMLDGSEIHEAVLTLLALSKRGIVYEVIAPNINQYHVINHVNQQEMPESRNMLIEAARIARGNIKDMAFAKVDDYDALIVPGGLGVAKNLCDFALRQDSSYTVEPTVEAFIKKFKNAHKPVGFICIAPVIAAAIYPKAHLTIGSDKSTAAVVEKKGAKHVTESVTGVCVDKLDKVVSTPAYMLAQNIFEVSEGIDHLIEAVVTLAKEKEEIA